MNTESSGLSIEDAQHAICKGTYSGKEWSASEKQAACVKYEQLTGAKLESSTRHLELWVIPVVSMTLVIGVAIVIYRLKTRKKTKKRR
jgi:hypothetical protein